MQYSGVHLCDPTRHVFEISIVAKMSDGHINVVKPFIKVHLVYNQLNPQFALFPTETLKVFNGAVISGDSWLAGSILVAESTVAARVGVFERA